MVAQQLEKIAQATSDASGSALFTFESVPQNLAWAGNVRVSGAPFTATFIARVGNDEWGEWQGPLFYGPFRVDSNRTLTVLASNLAPATTYIATWRGVSDDSVNVGPQVPTSSSPTPLAFPSTTFLEGTTKAAVLGTAVFPCSNVRGARYRFFNFALQPVTIVLSWFADADANIDLGQRVVILPAFNFAAGAAVFTHPHLGDFLQIACNPHSGNLNLQTHAAHHDSPEIVWSNQTQIGGLPDALIAVSDSIASAGETIELAQRVFAGKATAYVRGGGVTFTVTLEAMDETGAWWPIGAWTEQDAFTTAPAMTSLTLPPAPLRVRLDNTGAGTHTFDFTLIPDAWGN